MFKSPRRETPPTPQNPDPCDTHVQNQAKFRVTIPLYIQGVSDKVARGLRREGARASFKPVKTIGKLFPRPKDRFEKERSRDIINKIKCEN